MFTIRNYSSEEQYDLAKFMEFVGDTYDVINCPLLYKIKDLPTVNYYIVQNVFEDIDVISSVVYGNPFMTYYIQYYNNDFRDRFNMDDKLSLFSIEDFAGLYFDLANGIIDGNG